MKLGFVINPIAGMGGRVGLKGTDGVLTEALRRGASPVAGERALETIERFIELLTNLNTIDLRRGEDIEWYTCAGSMGYDVLTAAGLEKVAKNHVQIIYEPTNPEKTTANDTKLACEKLVEARVELILFCGGDGTARDVYSVVKDKVLLLGIPAGVKMHSGVFAMHAKTAGDLLLTYYRNEMDTADGEVLDLDEDLYRAGEWNIRLFGVAKTPYDANLIQRGKHLVETASENVIKEEIAEFIKEDMAEQPEIMYILGSGSTLQAIANHLGIKGTLLGIDAVLENRLLGTDLNEQQLLKLLEEHHEVKLILSPIGAQGFILGRGNLQLSPEVIKKIGIDNIEVVSTPAKLDNIEVLRVDTNDAELDRAFITKGWFPVKVGYRQMKLKKIGI